ncbi:GNAT family N-acetyltransferase [Chryseobacterium sp. KMC2]|uniref:GNAT family N-acetyltransferase n=1 Tax=Chryseobacterium sp. KMC2 TaxID=2800705 RepID=UPI0019217921|nr:GNAT family N-acetyltransferase [Chryseobacterium sp. KMC2]MBL3545968.1 GNAT family N-acetyltransferase [Chryseobacterium sp. KMC2]
MQITKYTASFRENCIEIFKSNLPKFFAAEELQLFEHFLDHETEENYYIIKTKGLVVGCGGIFLDEKKNEAGLSWGMIHAGYHGQGMGKLLTQFRLDLLKKKYPDKNLKIETSQHTAEFYKKNGFTIVDIVPDGFAEGIDKYTMKIEFKSELSN